MSRWRCGACKNAINAAPVMITAGDDLRPQAAVARGDGWRQWFYQHSKPGDAQHTKRMAFNRARDSLHGQALRRCPARLRLDSRKACWLKAPRTHTQPHEGLSTPHIQHTPKGVCAICAGVEADLAVRFVCGCTVRGMCGLPVRNVPVAGTRPFREDPIGRRWCR